MKKIAIIGFGGAGYSAAKEARQRDAEAEIHVYSDTDLGPYNPMLTTYYVKGTIPYDALFPFGSLEEVQKELKLIVHPHTPVTGLDPAAKTVRLSDGSEAQYDAILISTGASAVKPQLEGIELPCSSRKRLLPARYAQVLCSARRGAASRSWRSSWKRAWTARS